MTPKLSWVRDALTDPQRRKHVVSRVIEGFVPTTLTCFAAVELANGFYWPLMAALASCAVGAVSTVGQYALYEFVLEPLGTAKNPVFVTGHYWEREPRSDEGETFVKP